LEISDTFEVRGRIVGVNSIPGEPEDHSSYRSELGGVSGVIETVNIVCEVHGITEGDIEVGLDGDQAMKNIFGKWLLNPRQADYDLLKDICAKIAKSSVTWMGRWVEGHQDDHIRYEDMDRWGQLNVECDGLAKVYWNACNERDDWLLPNQAFANEGWSVWIEEKKLTKLDQQAIYNYVFSKRTKAYWSRKHHLSTTNMITNINWGSMSEIAQSAPLW
jgi:hypothetical protein